MPLIDATIGKSSNFHYITFLWTTRLVWFFLDLSRIKAIVKCNQLLGDVLVKIFVQKRIVAAEGLAVERFHLSLHATVICPVVWSEGDEGLKVGNQLL